MPSKKTTTKDKKSTTSAKGVLKAVKTHATHPITYAKKQRSASLHKSFRLTPRRDIKAHKKSVPGSAHIVRETVQVIKARRGTFLRLFTIGFLIHVLFVGLPSQEIYGYLKESIDEFVGDSGTERFIGLGSLSLAILSGVTAEPASELQQFLNAVIVLILWLSFLWIARQSMAGNATSVREALYNAPVAIVPMLLVLVMIAVQSIPAVIGTYIIVQSIGAEAIVTGGVAMLLSVLGVLLITLSLYWILHTFLALIIVALPNTYPWAAVRSAKLVAMGNRPLLFRKLFVLIMVTGVVWLLVILPVVFIDAWINSDWVPLVALAIEVLTLASLMFTSVYCYRLYRYLLQ